MSVKVFPEETDDRCHGSGATRNGNNIQMDVLVLTKGPPGPLPLLEQWPEEEQEE